MTPVFVYAATVERVVDGDTLDVDLDLGMRVHLRARLRLAYVNAPERYTAEGRAALTYVRDLLPDGAPITVATQKPDKYGRTLATIRLADGTDLADELVRVGHAVSYAGGAT